MKRKYSEHALVAKTPPSSSRIIPAMRLCDHMRVTHSRKFDAASDAVHRTYELVLDQANCA